MEGDKVYLEGPGRGSNWFEDEEQVDWFDGDGGGGADWDYGSGDTGGGQVLEKLLVAQAMLKMPMGIVWWWMLR